MTSIKADIFTDITIDQSYCVIQVQIRVKNISKKKLGFALGEGLYALYIIFNYDSIVIMKAFNSCLLKPIYWDGE